MLNGAQGKDIQKKKKIGSAALRENSDDSLNDSPIPYQEQETEFYKKLKARLLSGEVIQSLEPKPRGLKSAEMWEKYVVDNASLRKP
jgi:hypothetical protein